MKNHYIPQFYLKNFSNGAGFVFVYDKHSRKSFSTTPYNIGAEHHFYSDDIEEYLADHHDGPSSTIIRKFESQQIICKNDRLKFSEFMIGIWRRVPKGRERADKLGPDIISNTLNEREQEMRRFLALNQDHQDISKYLSRFKSFMRVKEKIETNELYRNEFIEYGWLSSIESKRTPESINALSRMEWTFLISSQPVFLTSDNPLFFFEDIGIGDLDSEVVFPVTNKVTLIATNRNSSDTKYRSVKKREISQINKRTATQAARFLFYSTELEWIPKFAHKKHELSKLKI